MRVIQILSNEVSRDQSPEPSATKPGQVTTNDIFGRTRNLSSYCTLHSLGLGGTNSHHFGPSVAGWINGHALSCDAVQRQIIAPLASNAFLALRAAAMAPPRSSPPSWLGPDRPAASRVLPRSPWLKRSAPWRRGTSLRSSGSSRTGSAETSASITGATRGADWPKARPGAGPRRRTEPAVGGSSRGANGSWADLRVRQRRESVDRVASGSHST